ncbi:MAG: hypothetical protein A2Y38_23790 [Spirochaetes bacterium GWB1_59_5]|nr:MAG: hypothetical protein A2Y38_23790 [Spirochaetes bacterium GWB1_59_5]
MDLKQHPLSAAFPGMTESDHAALTADILAYGLREPIVLYEGMVLDGWHRYQSCVQIKEKPAFRTLENDVDPVAFVKSHNLHRRHLSGSQRAVAVAACSKWAQRGRQGSKVEPGSTLAQMAKEADVSTKTIQQAKKVIDAGMESKVVSGEMTVRQVAEQVAPPKPKTEPKAVAPDVIEQPHVEQGQPIAAEPDHTEELQTMVEELLAEQQAFEKILDADDKLAEAVKEIRTLKAQNAALRSELDGKQNKENEMIRMVKSLQRQIKKLEQERDKDKVKTVGGMPI